MPTIAVSFSFRRSPFVSRPVASVGILHIGNLLNKGDHIVDILRFFLEEDGLDALDEPSLF